MALVELVYASAATHPMREAELDQLLSKSRIHNALCDLTGLLIHDSGSFLQVLEGEADEVDRLFATIARDPRHGKVVMLSRQSIEARTFGSWRMGFAKLDPTLARPLTGHFDPGQEWPKPADIASDSRPFFFLRGFRAGKWHRHIDGR